MDPRNPMAEFVDVIRAKWWKGKNPPTEDRRWHMGRDLNIVKQYLAEGVEREDLLGALARYEGPAATLKLIRRDLTGTTGLIGRALLNKLIGEFRKSQAPVGAVRVQGEPEPLGDVLDRLGWKGIE